MPNTHDECGGDEDLMRRVAQTYRAARFMRLDDDALIRGIVTAVAEQLAAATARAEKAEQELAERDQLTDEYGIRAVDTSTLTMEAAVADTLAGALGELEQFDAQGRGDVVSRELIWRKVGPWRNLEEAGRG